MATKNNVNRLIYFFTVLFEIMDLVGKQNANLVNLLQSTENSNQLLITESATPFNKQDGSFSSSLNGASKRKQNQCVFILFHVICQLLKISQSRLPLDTLFGRFSVQANIIIVSIDGSCGCKNQAIPGSFFAQGYTTILIESGVDLCQLAQN